MLLYTDSTSSLGAHVAQQRCAKATTAFPQSSPCVLLGVQAQAHPQKRSRGTDTVTAISDGNRGTYRDTSEAWHELATETELLQNSEMPLPQLS